MRHRTNRSSGVTTPLLARPGRDTRTSPPGQPNSCRQTYERSIPAVQLTRSAGFWRGRSWRRTGRCFPDGPISNQNRMAIQGISTISNKSHSSIVAEVNVARTLSVIPTSGQWSDCRRDRLPHHHPTRIGGRFTRVRPNIATLWTTGRRQPNLLP